MGYRVMIVDDSKLARMAVAKAISALYPNWSLTEAPTADVALSLARGNHIDIAVIDYNMPGRHGLSLAADLRSRYPTMPLALITANFQAEVVLGARELDIMFVQKPNWQTGLAEFLSDAVARLGVP
jgi:DNA-binding NarL/FixJ family response regulator